MKKLVLYFVSILYVCFCFAGEKSNADSLLSRIEKSTSVKEKINLYNSLSAIYWYNKPSKTIEYSKKALELAIQIENDSLIVNSRINIGIGYTYVADYEKAMSQFIQCLQLAEKINFKSGIANSLSNIAIIYDYLGNYSKAEVFYIKALKINKEIKEEKGIIGGLNNLGILYYKTKAYQKALDCYNEALIREKEINEMQMIAITLSNIGDVYEAKGEEEKALEYFKKSLNAGEELKNNTLIISSMINIGKVMFEKGNYAEASGYFSKSLALSNEFGFISFTKDIYKYSSALFEKQGNSQKALEYYKKYDSLKSTLLSEESNNKITELQIKYETEAKENENVILLKDNKYQKNFRNYLLVLTAFVIVIAFLTFKGYRNKLKTSKLLLEKNEVISLQKSQLEVSMSKLQQSEEMYKSLVNTSPDGIVITDLKARITYASPALIKLYGPQSNKVIVGKSALSYIVRPQWKIAVDYFTDIINGKNRDAIELKGIKSNGNTIEIEINGNAIKDNQGKVSHLFFMFRDITRRKEIEQENMQQQKLLFEQSKEISKLELLKKEQENHNLMLDIEFKSKELVSKAMYLIQNNELIEDIVKKLKELENRLNENKQISSDDIHTLINELKNSNRNESWKEFDAHFTQVHNGFYENLMASFPDLSPNEKKLCGFLRLNLSTKEISDITKKSIHSINVARTRLRQKLGMTNTDDNLSSFLSQFG